MKRLLTIIVRAAQAGLLEIGEDCTPFGQPGYTVESIGKEFADRKGWQVVAVTLIERPAKQ